MGKTAIIIVSRDRDFADPLAELAASELGVACHKAENIKEAGAYMEKAALVVSSEPVAGKTPCPLVVPASKPFKLQALLADISDILQKSGSDEGMAFGGWRLQMRQKQLYSASGASVDLTDKEAQLLGMLILSGEAGISKEQLLKEVWGIEAALDTHTLETHIYRLRGKFRELSGSDDIITASAGLYVLKE